MLHAQPSTLQHVLLVEDDRDLRATLALLLSEAGYQVHLASSLDEAHIQVERRSFALVLVGIYIDYAQHQLARLRELRHRVMPAPLGLLMTRPMPPEEACGSSFAFIERMPFQVDDLLQKVAFAIGCPASVARVATAG